MKALKNSIVITFKIFKLAGKSILFLFRQTKNIRRIKLPRLPKPPKLSKFTKMAKFPKIAIKPFILSRSLNQNYPDVGEEFSSLKTQALRLGLTSTGDDPVPPESALEVWFSKLENKFKPMLEKIEMRILIIKSELQIIYEELGKPKEERLADLRNKYTPGLNEDLEKYEEGKNHLLKIDERIITLDQEISFFNTALLKALDRLGGIPPIRGSMDKKLAVFAVFLVFVIVELSIITYAFNALRFSTYVGFLVAIVLSGVVTYSASLIGEGIGNQHKTDIKNGLILGVFTILTITYVRFKGATAIAERNNLELDHTQDYFLLSVNILLWATAIFIESKRFERLTYFEAIENREIRIEEKAELQDQRNSLSSIDEQKGRSIHENFESKLANQLDQETRNLTSKKLGLERELQRLEIKNSQILSRLSSIKEDWAREFHENFNKGVRNRRPKLGGSHGMAAIILTMIFSLGTRCTSLNDNIIGKKEHIEIWLVPDETIDPANQNEVNAESLRDFIAIDVMGLDVDEAPRMRVDVYTTTINKLAMPPLKHVASLKMGQAKAIRVQYDRVDSIQIFLDRVEEAVQDIFTNGKGLGKSQVNQCLCRGLNRLAHSNATRKIMLVNSDFLENADLSFHSRNLKQLVERKYEGIISSFSEACPLEDLTGIELIGFYTPTEANQKKVLIAQQFWKHYLESYHAKVTFTPNF